MRETVLTHFDLPIVHSIRSTQNHVNVAARRQGVFDPPHSRQRHDVE